MRGRRKHSRLRVAHVLPVGRPVEALASGRRSIDKCCELLRIASSVTAPTARTGFTGAERHHVAETPAMEEAVKMEAAVGTKRERFVTWSDPVAAAKSAIGMTGRQVMEAIRDGRHPEPPMAVLVGFHIRDVDEGRLIMTLEPHDALSNPMSLIHGGAVATVIDSAMACAVYTLLPSTRGVSTLEIKINYVRPLRLDMGEIACEGRVLNLGRQTALAEGDIKDAAGKLYIHATATFSVFDY
jgi:uncharacterized protein (TIGR00369 family)